MTNTEIWVMLIAAAEWISANDDEFSSTEMQDDLYALGAAFKNNTVEEFEPSEGFKKFYVRLTYMMDVIETVDEDWG